MRSDVDDQQISSPLGRFSRRMVVWRWPMIAAWLVVLGLSLAAGSQVSQLLTNRFIVPGSEYQRVEALLEDHFGQISEGAFQIVIVADDAPTGDRSTSTPISLLAAPDAELMAAAEAAGAAAARELPDGAVGAVAPISEGIAVVQVTSPLEQAEGKALVDEMRAAVRASLPSDMRGYLAGGGAFAADLDPVLAEDLARGELFFAIPIALIVLMLVFGSFGFLLPFMFAVATIPATIGIVWIFANFTDLSSYILNLVVGVGLGVSIDYSLLLYWRYREERLRSDEPSSDSAREEAVVRTMVTAGRAVIFSGLAVAIGLALLLLMPLPFIKGFGIAGLIIPLVSVAAALTLMPGLLYLTAHRFERVRFVSRRRMRARDTLDDNGWARLARLIMQRPIPFFMASAGVLLALTVPATQIELTPGSNVGLPDNLESIAGVKILEKTLGEGAITPSIIVIDGGRANGARSKEVRAAVDRLTKAIAADREVEMVAPISPSAFDTSGRYLKLEVVNEGAYGDQATRKFVNRARDQLIPQADFPKGTRAMIGGSPALGVDLVDTAYSSFPTLVAGVLVLTYLLLLRAFRSLLLPLKAIVLNLLSIGAAYGVLELVFDTGFADLVGLTSYGPIEFWIPIFLFAMLFGLSMDYEVFLVSRMREFWDETHDNELAVSRGLAATGRLVTAAGIIMVTAFAGFLASRPVGFQQFGLGLAVAILIDVTIVRALLLPSAMRLFGRWNWWLPTWVARLARVEPSPLRGPNAGSSD